jgi:hypothetical protein
MALPIPVGLWAHVLAKTSKECGGIFFILTEQPDMVTQSRKRKSREQEDFAGRI